MASVKKNITLDSIVIEKVKEYADSNGLSFSGSLAVLAMARLEEIKAINAMGQVHTMIEEFKKGMTIQLPEGLKLPE